MKSSFKDLKTCSISDDLVFPRYPQLDTDCRVFHLDNCRLCYVIALYIHECLNVDLPLAMLIMKHLSGTKYCDIGVVLKDITGRKLGWLFFVLSFRFNISLFQNLGVKALFDTSYK